MTGSSTVGNLDGLAAYARRGVWALPVYSALLLAGTVTHQPDYRVDFPGYAGYITTGRFLASHLVASIASAAIGLVGVVAVCILVARGRSLRAATAGTVAAIFGNVIVTAVFGVATFAQPAIGRAYEAGVAGVVDLNADVYGTPLFATAGTGILLIIAGAILLGTAIARTDRSLRWAGIGYATFLSLFAVTGFLVDVAQPIAAAALAIVTVVIALRLQRGVPARRLPPASAETAGGKP